jgi:hypothetical protein
MGGLSLIVAVVPAMGLVALCASLTLTRIAGCRSGRGNWPPQPGYGHCGAVEYLYVPCVRMSGSGSAAEPRRWVQAVPVVRKTAKWIYYASDSWNRREAVAGPGRISREQFETDTRHRGRPGYPAGVIPVPGDRQHPGPAGRLFFATRQAAEHHLHRTERERTGKTAPQAPPGKAAPQALPLKELRRAMADAHPDRGGTVEQFIQAHRRYQTALRAA